ncbi:MAG: type II toxin-antitoxin system VapC family toxin [Chloroflexota bacterium]
MSDLVLDASVLAKWYQPEGEDHVEAAERVHLGYLSGKLTVIAPPLLFVEVLNSAARRWRWEPARLLELADALSELAFKVETPSFYRVAHWAALGLTAYDASYVALAERNRSVVVTTDRLILSIAGDLAQSLDRW